jgi:hypothetical protein
MLAAVKWARFPLGKQPLVPLACFEMDKSSSLEMAGASALAWAYIVVDMEPAEQDMKISHLDDDDDMLVTFPSECLPLQHGLIRCVDCLRLLNYNCSSKLSWSMIVFILTRTALITSQ